MARVPFSMCFLFPFNFPKVFSVRFSCSFFIQTFSEFTQRFPSVDKDPVHGVNIVQCVEPVATSLHVCLCVPLCIVALISLHPVARCSIARQASANPTVAPNAPRRCQAVRWQINMAKSTFYGVLY